MNVFGQFASTRDLARVILIFSTFLHWTSAVFWVQPGMNHVVACCDIVSFKAMELTTEDTNRAFTNTATLNDTPVSELIDFQPPESDSASLSVPAGAVVLPLVSSFHFQPHHWYNVCVTRQESSVENGPNKNETLPSFCFPARPCECACNEDQDESGWLRILISASFESGSIHLRILSTFSPDNLLRVKFNVTLQSNTYYEVCNEMLELPSNTDEDDAQERYQMRLRQCRREPEPIEAHQIPPNEMIQIPAKKVGGVPFYILLAITIRNSQKNWGWEIVHKLDPVKVVNSSDTGENGINGNKFERWLTVPIPTPRIEEEHRPVLDWDEEDSRRICPHVNEKDCEKSITCSRAAHSSFPRVFLFLTVVTVIAALPLFI